MAAGRLYHEDPEHVALNDPWGMARLLDSLRRAGAHDQAAALAARAATGDSSVHIVQSGDTLSGIASSHGISLDQLRALNPGLFDAAHHNGNLIHAACLCWWAQLGSNQ